ncbi:MAG: hypothetical protein Q8K96_07160 [Rubrivivax sp.]|nr:hypothetical protein [Rubrivivax sp.]
MANAVNSNRWFSGRRAEGRPVEVDPADLGTAFGLDLSLTEVPDAPSPPAEERRAGWMRRLADRRKPAA